MKRLKETTIKRYNASQLSNHLDRLLNAFKCAPYRCDQCGIWELDEDAYYWFCNYTNRDAILDAIYDVYRQLGL